MPKILTLSDDGVISGFGRIAMHLNSALARRGYHIMAASLQYDGLLPPHYEDRSLPYWVASLAGKNWLEESVKLVNVYQPDIILVIQDAPYAHHLRHAPIDWSKHALVIITPVDGTPIFPDWLDTVRRADAALTISEFGVCAFREAGISVGLCRPGIDPGVFYPLPDSERAALRTRLNIAPDAFVLGMFAQNQGRKDIPDTLRAFFTFARDKPSARLLLDMDAVSPAGWNIPAMCQQFGWDAGKIIFKIDAQRAGLTHLRERYNLLDTHAVLSHREGFGLPLIESMACGVVTMALDWCSGTEIVGDGRGILVKPIGYTSVSTWGNALDYFPDVDAVVSNLTWLCEKPDERRAMAQRGLDWARTLTWDCAVNNVATALERTLAGRKIPVSLPA